MQSSEKGLVISFDQTDGSRRPGIRFSWARKRLLNPCHPEPYAGEAEEERGICSPPSGFLTDLQKVPFRVADLKKFRVTAILNRSNEHAATTKVLVRLFQLVAEDGGNNGRTPVQPCLFHLGSSTEEDRRFIVARELERHIGGQRVITVRRPRDRFAIESVHPPLLGCRNIVVGESDGVCREEHGSNDNAMRRWEERNPAAKRSSASD